MRRRSCWLGSIAVLGTITIPSVHASRSPYSCHYSWPPCTVFLELAALFEARLSLRRSRESRRNPRPDVKNKDGTFRSSNECSEPQGPVCTTEGDTGWTKWGLVGNKWDRELFLGGLVPIRSMTHFFRSCKVEGVCKRLHTTSVWYCSYD